MAQLALAVGMSHGPMVVSEAEAWLAIGERDRSSTLLRDTSGTPVTFSELAQANGDRYAAEVTLERLRAQREQVKRALARLRTETEAADPDVLVVIGDDQFELFDLDNMPALGIYYGEELISCTRGRRGQYRPGELARGYGMDRHRRWPGHEPLARHLIASLIERGFDVAALGGIEDPERAGIGHAFGIVEMQLIEEGAVPLVPVLVNTYWPPNQVTPTRCRQLGLALREAIDAYPKPLRVGLAASGGLSHFVLDERLDALTLQALRAADLDALCRLPAHLLGSGNSEVRNWIVVAAACRDRALSWDEYVPAYRTAAGTGCGLTFARWRESA